MYIQPNSEVRLLTNVPLDNTYAHTIYFANKNTQANYFISKTKTGCHFSHVSYQRHTRPSMKVEKLADNIYDCNYLMFKNTTFGDKWFYAFIRDIEYVGNTVSEIFYEIDVMQTWFFDVTLLQSFVEREHSATDVAGDNLIPEPVTIGDYFNTAPISTELFDEFALILCCPYKRNEVGGIYRWSNLSDDIPIPPNTIDNQKTGLYYSVIKDDIVAGYCLYELNDQGLSEEIVSIYPVPLEFVKGYTSTYQHVDVLTGTTPIKSFTYYASNEKPTTLGSYTPKNKKLLTYPYNKFVIETGDGTKNEYAFEFFGNNSVTFQIHGNLLENTSFKAVPLLYKGAYVNYSEGCLLTDFPQTGYSIDTYRAWLAQNKTRLAIQGVSSLLAGSGGVGQVIGGSQMLTPVTKVLSKKGAETMAQGPDCS